MSLSVVMPNSHSDTPTANPTVVTVSATADAADGTSPLNTLAIFADGTATCSGSTNSVSGTWSPTTDGAHTIYAEATYANGVPRSPINDPLYYVPMALIRKVAR